MIMRFLLALDVFICHIITGQGDLTISGWAYIRQCQGKWTPIKFIDWLFRLIRGQKTHCKDAFIWEMEQSRKMLNDYSKFLP
ncbi:hypothetical protein NTE19_003373 [Vibrio fluvialis]|nr:hypothetical protein [Vibrio fluvialis]